MDILYCFFWNDLDILSNLRSHIVEVSLYVLLGCLAVILPIILNKKFRKSIFNFKFESDRLFVIIVIVITLNIIISYLIGIKDSIISAKLFHYSINTTGLLRGVIYEILKYTFFGLLEEFFFIFSFAFFIEYILRESEYSENKKSFITVLAISIPFLLSHEYSFIISNGSGILFVYSLFTRLYQVFISVYIRKKTNNILLTTLIHMLWNVSVSLPAYLDNI
ncbi:CPBP family intramembrane metalloprotease [Thiospirochaeta perfilievii]|uniref:CPBP family intramembrane metalloprotease n=1 Tax=Thiospirochaeta perfilievii TaxID=252967 RepID=UPI0016596012|nr:CPBP family intramembrane metalloprotease [Thiospirochaeta perfilievii]